MHRKLTIHYSANMTSSPVKFLVADDHPIIRLGVRQLIAGAWPDAVIREADTIESAVQLYREFAPDVVVLDLLMPDTTGNEGAVRMLRVAPDTPILVLSGNEETAFASRLLQMGVAGYLQKDRAADELVIALRRLLDGKRYVTPALAEYLVDMIGGRSSNSAPHEMLSSQEHRVMLMMAAGHAPAQIAETMQLSVKTVGTYRARILDKTGWKSNVELAKYCLQNGLAEES
jgi:two-component system invasion response regulator UvrY